MNKIFISFDVDGTLVKFDNNIGTHMKAFSQAITELFSPIGEPDDFLGYPIAGWMDKKIIHHILEKLNVEPNEKNLNLAMNRTEEIFEELFTQTPIIPPGIEKTLKLLSEMPNVTIGVASGNLEKIAWKKINNANLIKYFSNKIGGFGGYVYERKDAVILSRKNAEKLMGHTFNKIIHIGDMPNDVIAANEAGSIAVAVKTGGIQFDKYPEPSIVLQNLEIDFEKFYNLIKE